MSIKTILALFSGEPDELGTLHTAFALAREHASALRILHIAEPPIFYDAITNYGHNPPLGVGKLEVLEKAAYDLTEAAQGHVKSIAGQYGFTLQNEGSPEMPALQAQFRLAIGTAKDCLPQESRTVDLIVTAYDNSPLGNLETLLAALFRSGRPVLAIPRNPGRNFGAGHFPNTVVVAWDGSLAAGRAARDAIPLMQQASAVYLVCAAEGQRQLDLNEQSDVMAYLHSHSVSPELLNVPMETQGIGATLLTQSSRLCADMLVMGGYGAGHVGEMILGGASNYVIKHATLPLLLSH